MSGKILIAAFWTLSLSLLVHSIWTGGWALAVPAATLLALILFGIDLFRHRELATPDLALLRTLLHVLSAVVLAATCMYWLARLVLGGGG